jgi:hypothetical protein
MIRQLFDERERYIEELASMISAQHQVINDIFARTKSQENFRQSHGLFESDQQDQIEIIQSIRDSLTPGPLSSNPK